jgi:hypothetical protein
LNHEPTNPSKNTIRSCESGRSRVSEDLLVVLLGGAVGKRELEVLGEELFDVRAANAVGLLDLSNAENLVKLSATHEQTSREVVTNVDGTETGTVTRSHVLVQSLNGIGSGELTELLVHVVGAGARVVTDPDGEVLDLLWALLVDLERRALV